MRKLVVVSGGTKGIGRAIVEKFAGNNYDVVTCARSTDDLEALKVNVEKRYRTNLYFASSDLSKKEEATRFAQYVLSLDRPIESLVNNAGYFEPGRITEEAEGTLERMINANMYSAYHLTRGLVGVMKKAKSGHIFSICSVASLYAYPNGGSYSISKFAMLGFTKVLREELKPYGIRVTAVMPGATLTSSWEGSRLPASRFIKPEDVADAVYGAFCLSPQAVIEDLVIRPQLGDI